LPLINRRAFAIGSVLGVAHAAAQERQPAKPKTFRRRDIAPIVKRIIVKTFGVDVQKITPHARLVEDLGADSLDVVELVMTFEDTFGIKITDADCTKMIRVSDAYALIEPLLRALKRLDWQA
jgi:acyl carrier protein